LAASETQQQHLSALKITSSNGSSFLLDCAFQHPQPQQQQQKKKKKKKRASTRLQARQPQGPSMRVGTQHHPARSTQMVMSIKWQSALLTIPSSSTNCSTSIGA
jgi:hypothetical protein